MPVASTAFAAASSASALEVRHAAVTSDGSSPGATTTEYL
jgi:hypothetical protein